MTPRAYTSLLLSLFLLLSPQLPSLQAFPNARSGHQLDTFMAAEVGVGVGEEEAKVHQGQLGRFCKAVTYFRYAHPSPPLIATHTHTRGKRGAVRSISASCLHYGVKSRGGRDFMDGWLL